MARIRLLALCIALTGCRATSNTSTTPSPAEPAYEEPYQEPAYEAPADQTTQLPGEYQAGIGNPYIHIVNQLDTDLSVSITDSAGYQYSAYAPAFGTYDVQISPGLFSYYASSGALTDSGQVNVEYDYAYTWTFYVDYGEGYDEGYDEDYDGY